MPRRRKREPAFGSDSFLDVVANLVGIVIILIVMVGGRVRELPPLALPSPKAERDTSSVPAIATPEGVLTAADVLARQSEAEQYAAQVADLQRQLLAVLRAADEQREREKGLAAQRAAAARERASIEARLNHEKQATAAAEQSAAAVEAQTPPLNQRLADLRNALKDIKPLPPERKLLRYHLPVSATVTTTQQLFECKNGRVTPIDMDGLLQQVKKVLPTKADELKGKWEATDVVGPIGAFQLRYTLERERGATDLTFGNLPPADDRRLAYGVTKWELVPAWPDRGETLAQALAAKSRFLHVVERLHPDDAVLTFFVYPDSFDLFRGLRDCLYDQGFVVAGRPLTFDAPIRGSRDGSLSRGQ